MRKLGLASIVLGIQLGMISIAPQVPNEISYLDNCLPYELEKKIEVVIMSLDFQGDALRIRAGVHNAGTTSVFVASAPRRSDGSEGPYLHLNDSLTLLIAYRLFELPTYTLYVNHAGVQLRRLMPGEKFEDELVL